MSTTPALARAPTPSWVLAAMLSLTYGCVPSDFDYDTADDWEVAAAEIRDGIAEHLAIDPDAPRPPLRPVWIHGRQVHDGYAIENVSFASLPGVYVTGNLYRPLDAAGRPITAPGSLPAVLNPHGHFFEPGWYPRTRPDMQARAATLARMGAVAFAWDMVGIGDSTQLEHDAPSVPALQTWNSLRAVDFVRSLPEVDPTRVAVTGASGGASQGFALVALDDRLAASVPVAMLSAVFAGGDPCEDLYPDGLHGTLEVDATAAPKPQLVISDGGDWTAHVPDRELPFLRHIYGLYGAETNLESVHFGSEGHDYGPNKRAAMYDFMARTLGLAAPGEEPPAVPHATLVVFDPGHPRPQDAVIGELGIAGVLRGLGGG